MSARPDLADAAATLAAAFAGGPMVSWVQPDLDRQRRTLPAMFGPVLDVCARYGGVEVVADGAAVCGWVPSTSLAVGVGDIVRSGFWRLPLPRAFGPLATLRLLRHEHVTDAVLHRYADPTVAYLWVVGCRPDRHGEGLGRRALEAGLGAMRRAGASACLLKTETPSNRGLYHHLGFDQVDEVTPRVSDVPAWVFLRQL